MAKNLSLRELAKMVGVSRQAISNYEAAVNIPTADVWDRLSGALELEGTYADYFGQDEPITSGRPTLWDGQHCQFEGCDRPVAAKGLCTTHYAQHRAGKELYTVESTKLPCAVDGCTEIARAKGYCNTHYRQALRGDRPHIVSPRKTYKNGDTCQVAGCEEKPYARGLCTRHYRGFLAKRKKAKNR